MYVGCSRLVWRSCNASIVPPSADRTFLSSLLRSRVHTTQVPAWTGQARTEWDGHRMVYLDAPQSLQVRVSHLLIWSTCFFLLAANIESPSNVCERVFGDYAMPLSSPLVRLHPWGKGYREGGHSCVGHLRARAPDLPGNQTSFKRTMWVWTLFPSMMMTAFENSQV